MGRGGNGGRRAIRNGLGIYGVGGGSQVGGGVSGAKPGSNVVIPIALTPYHAVSDIIYYTTLNGIKQYTKVTAHIETYFDIEAQSLKSFLAQVEDRVFEDNWDNVINIDDSSGD